MVLPEERQLRIATRLASGERVVALDLSREFNTSEDTIRRDLRELAAAGLCRRVYGGALPVSPAIGPLSRRAGEARQRKAALGRAAARLVTRGQTLLIDAGSTNIAVAEALPDGLDLTVVTNAPRIAAALEGQAGIRVVMIGGRLDPAAGGAVDAAAVAQLAGLHADLCVLGVCAVSAEAGLGAFHWDELAFKRAAIAASRGVAVAATTEKLQTEAAFAKAALSAAHHLIVEADAPHVVLAGLSAAGPRIHVAESCHE